MSNIAGDAVIDAVTPFTSRHYHLRHVIAAACLEVTVTPIRLMLIRFTISYLPRHTVITAYTIFDFMRHSRATQPRHSRELMRATQLIIHAAASHTLHGFGAGRL